MIDFVAFGIIIDDIVLHDGRAEMGVLGGGGPQSAWGMAAALGSGERVGLAAGVGSDLDQGILTRLKSAGINLDGLRTTSHPTPRAWQVTELDGRRTQVWRTLPQGDQLAKKWEFLPPAYQSANHFHWGIHLEDGTPPLARQLKQMNKRVSLESFKAPPQALTASERHAIFETCMIFSAATHELAAMIGSRRRYEDALAQFKAAGGRFLVERQGEDGATVFDCWEKQSFHVPAVETQVVDETGAGNAFCGAFLARIGDGGKEALCHGVVAASYMIEQIGIPPRLPDADDYQRRMDSVRGKIVTRSINL